jgi:hypothetical protein
MRFSFLLFVAFIYGVTGFSQDFKITKINNRSFPKVKLTVTLNEARGIGDLKILEQGKDIQFVVDSTTTRQNSKAVFYLLDINRLSPIERQNVFDALLEAVTEIKAGTLINIGFVSGNNVKNCFIPLSYEFTENRQGLLQFMNESNFLYLNENMRTNSDCALLKTIDFIHKKKNLPKQIVLVVLSKDIRNITMVNKFLKAGANEYHIDVKLIGNVLENYIVEPVGFYPLPNGFIVKDLNENLIQAVQNNNLTSLQETKNYTLEFVGTQNNALNYFEIRYMDQRIKTFYTKPDKKTFKMLWFILAILVLILVLAFFIRKQIHLKKRLASLTETVSLLFDKRVKILGRQTFNPVVELRINDYIKNYHIKKLTTTLGRGKDCDLKIDDLTISSHHASITNEGGEFYIKDNESTNGVFVNDLKIDKKIIKNGDIIRLGKAILMIHY